MKLRSQDKKQRFDVSSHLEGLHGDQRRCMKSLDYYLRKYNSLSLDGGKILSYARQAQRRTTLRRIVHQLYELGFKLVDIVNLKPKHVEALAKHWFEMGLKGSSINIYFSSLVALAQWIEKKGMVLSPKSYYENPAFLKSRTAAEKPIGWFEQPDFDLDGAIRGIVADDVQVMVVLLLQSAFGLRIAEASQCHPIIGDQQTHLEVNWGPKGGRKRSVPIREEHQSEVLDLAKQFAIGPSGSMIPKQYSKKQWLDHMSYVLRKNGISRKNGLTPHGLRHSYAVRLYERLTDSVAPVKGVVDAALDKATAYQARQITAQHLGHNRDVITNMYTGNPRVAQKQDGVVSTHMTREEIAAVQTEPARHHQPLEIFQRILLEASQKAEEKEA